MDYSRQADSSVLVEQVQEAADLSRCGASSRRLTRATETAALDALPSLWAPSACSTTESTRGSSIGLKQLPTASVILGCRRAPCKTLTRAGRSLAACNMKTIPLEGTGCLR